ncbi:hypothetical protein ANCDUO_26875 [Ancylostoma duodenale]|uniref:Uncharacterized protein n=1 Tax=Ancylostoma duodenale TaxID=51022 RepID=A0A0C2FDI8_9BILA|nr:hypothetical protein ANCDUO_26875 [Ancylostoma duodenale]
MLESTSSMIMDGRRCIWQRSTATCRLCTSCFSIRRSSIGK